MVARHLPPSRTSIETDESGISELGPPNQSANRSGSAHSLQIRSRGASKTRVIAMPGSAEARGSGDSVIVLSYPCLEPVEASFPERTILLEPFDGVSERLRPQPAVRVSPSASDPRGPRRWC